MIDHSMNQVKNKIRSPFSTVELFNRKSQGIVIRYHLDNSNLIIQESAAAVSKNSLEFDGV